MRQYHELCQRILSEGEQRGDRTGTGTLSVFGHQSTYDLREGFPLLTTKKMWSEKGGSFRLIVEELLWFLRGQTNNKYLLEKDVHIWDEWADSNGELGRIYGAQWRSWNCYDSRSNRYRFSGNDVISSYARTEIDQIGKVIHDIRTDPYSRRLIVSAWNVAELPKMNLPPCHLLFQFYVHTDGRLDCQLYQRSADVFLGAPFNIASYALLISIIAALCGLTPGTFIHTIGDAHIYCNHIEQVKTQLSREPLPLPKLTIEGDVNDLDNLSASNFVITGYQSHGTLKGDVSV